MNDIVSIKLKGRLLRPHKAIVGPLLSSRTVLTQSPWEFVSLWLKKEKQNDALFYWDQAREFHHASLGLPVQSAPLLQYYSFMNAVKALLTAKNISFVGVHGVKSHNMRSPTSKISITNEGVKIKNTGILPSLSAYLGEGETKKTHSLQELLFNLPCIHRTYCLTFPSQTGMFIPVKDCKYVVNKSTKKASFRATLSEDFSNMHVVKRMLPAFALDSKEKGVIKIKSTKEVDVSRPKTPTANDLKNLRMLHRTLRVNLFYINGTETLWYIRAKTSGPRILSRFTPTIALAAMHRLSELCRYKPLELTSFLSGQKNWLLSEFIQQTPEQFLDEIASEITGHQFLVPNVRGAN
jgi:hypothetical protein